MVLRGSGGVNRPLANRGSTPVGLGMARERGRLRPWSRTVTVLTAIGIACASCGGSPAAVSNTSTSSARATSTPPATTASARAATTTLPAVDVAILTAYRAGWAAFEAAEASANPFDPQLAATMVNPLLHQVEGYLVADHEEGIVGRGPIALHPHVLSATAATATVLDCSYSASYLVYRRTGKQVPPVTGPEHVGVKATLVLEGSTWKVRSQQLTEGSCPVGY